MLYMSTDMTYQIESTSPEDTLSLAAKIGANLKGGEVIELVSDLGGGKTVFVRGLAEGMGSDDQVASPTFTISREYKAGELELHHFDFYRLDDPGIIQAELEESIDNSNVAVAIEWPGIIKGALPDDRLSVSIQRTGDESRSLTIEAGKMHQHLIKGLAKT